MSDLNAWKAAMLGRVKKVVKPILRKVAPRGVLPRLKLMRLATERRLYRRKIGAEEFRDALLRLGEWKGRVVWVQISLNDLYNVEMRPSEIIEMMLDLVGPEGTLVMPAFPLDPDPSKELRIDTVPSNTGLVTEMFRRMPGAERSIHIRSSVAALGPDAAWLTSGHHLGKYPWGETSPYGRLVERKGLMVGLGIVPLGFTPLHSVECALHYQVPTFRKAIAEEMTYAWRRRSGETGTHTTFLRKGWINPGRLIRHLPAGLLRQFRVSNLTFQSAPAHEAVEALKVLALRNKTIYTGL